MHLTSFDPWYRRLLVQFIGKSSIVYKSSESVIVAVEEGSGFISLVLIFVQVNMGDSSKNQDSE
jgi:hypothetical protein